MHQRPKLRRLALALAVPVVAIGGIALTAHAAASSTSTGVRVAATDPGQQDPGQQNQQPGGSGAPGKAPLTAIPPKTFVTKSGAPSGSKTVTPSKSVTPSRTATPSRSASGSASGGAQAPGQPGPGGVVMNCAKNSVPTPVTVKMGQAGGKAALVDADGCALYVNTQDTPQTSACDAQCQTTWGPLKGPAQAGDGVTQENLNTFAREDGTVQVTYYGRQLYYFAGDTSPGPANGQGTDQIWYLVDQSGNPVTS